MVLESIVKPQPPKLALLATRSTRNWAVPQCGRVSILANPIDFPNPGMLGDLCALCDFRAFPILPWAARNALNHFSPIKRRYAEISPLDRPFRIRSRQPRPDFSSLD